MRAFYAHGCHAAAVIIALAAIAVGLVVLIGGWWLDIEVLRQPASGYSAMRAGTAVGLAVAGLGILGIARAWATWFQAASGAVLAALGAVVLGSYAAGQAKTEFEGLFARQAMDDAVPGRIALNTALCFLLLGAGLLLIAARRADSLRQSLGLMVSLIAYAALVGTVMSSLVVAGVFEDDFTAMSPFTAVPLLFLGFAIVLVSVEHGWARTLTDSRTAGRLLRAGVPFILVLFLFAGWMFVRVAGISDANLGRLALSIVLLVAVLIVALVAVTARIENLDVALVSLESDFTSRVAEATFDARQAMSILQAILDNSSELIMRYDRNHRVAYVNSKVVEASGRLPDDWIGRTVAEAGYTPEFTAQWDAALERVLVTGKTETFEFEIDNMNSHRWYESTIAAEHDESGAITHALSSSHDITVRKTAELKLAELATRDPLTGLANRSALLAELARALSAGSRSGRPTAVLMLDLDRFKQINDSLGHSFGDCVLEEVAHRLNATVRSSDVVARPGGDEFIVVMRDLANLTEPIRAAERIIASLRQSFSIEGTEIFTTASVGVTIASGIAFADDVLREADTAMYAAKNDGRDRVALYNAELRTVVTERLTLENDLRRAVDREEFLVYYQPEVDFATGEIVAVEALVRWQHPDGRLRMAQEFIETAEETGLIREIGEWVMREACAQAAVWAAQSPDHPIIVRVNLSAVQLSSPTLADGIDAALVASGIDPSTLCFEITETALLRDTVTVRSNVLSIRDRGIKIAIDDFGTGFASLAYLRDYPVSALKIDRMFVTSMLTSDIDHRLVAGIIALAERFGVTVTAEGVEEQIQAMELQAMGCPAAQGFLYSEAVPAVEIDALMAHTYAHS
ncbi:MAG: EAL domain-containing protein [Candidatus Nanopelagicales bacterium]|nr:EAL domain-containing protein [Candidatus Nanopelagicales bacterium]